MQNTHSLPSRRPPAQDFRRLTRIVTQDLRTLIQHLRKYGNRTLSPEEGCLISNALSRAHSAREPRSHNSALDDACAAISRITNKHCYVLSLRTRRVACPPSDRHRKEGSPSYAVAYLGGKWGLLRSTIVKGALSRSGIASPGRTVHHSLAHALELSTARPRSAVSGSEVSRQRQRTPPAETASLAEDTQTRAARHKEPPTPGCGSHDSAAAPHVAGTIVSCNVRSLFGERGARIRAIDSLFAENPQTLALALQETRCGADSVPKLRDDLVYLCPNIQQAHVIRQGRAPSGERLTSGLAIIARRDLSPSIVQDATNGHILTVSLEILARDEKLRLFLCSTYINPHDRVRKEVMRQVNTAIRKLLASHPNSPVYITGDFNMSREEMEAGFMKSLNDSKPRPATTLMLLPKKMFDDGNIYPRRRTQTQKPARGFGRDIDHVIAVSPTPRSANMAVVHLTLSTQFKSDHHPIVFPAVVYPRSQAPEHALAASLSPKVPDAYKEGMPWAPIEAVTGSRPFRRMLQHKAASLNSKEQWGAVRERLTQATGNEAGRRNEAYIAAKELIHANMRALFIARIWKPPRQRLTTPPCDTIEDELLTLASSLSTSVGDEPVPQHEESQARAQDRQRSPATLLSCRCSLALRTQGHP